MNPIPGDADLARWEFKVDVKEARGEFDFGGPFVRGIRDDRHIGLAWGEVSDAVPFTLHRGVTLQFKDITPSTIREAIRPKRRLVGRLGLTDDGGSPRSARVLPPAVTWTAEPIWSTVVIRPRSDADLALCERLARGVHAVDGYPPYLPDGDLYGFLVSPDALGAWVAEEGDEIIGHVALHARSSDPVMALASDALTVAPEHLGVVARLLVDPEARGQGIGRSLLASATRHALDRGLWPILDVVSRFQMAISLYESSGWVRIGQVMFRLPDGTDVEEVVYAAPGARHVGLRGQ
jgi:GNAT superfamily N-acetyltransferase